MLEVSRSGYYAYKKRPKSSQRIANDKLFIEIRRVFMENEENYGSPRIWNGLNNVEGIACSENRVARLMQINRIVAVHKREFRVMTNSKHNYPVWPNVLGRNFSVSNPNKVWVTDITYVWTQEGWLYVEAVLDLFFRGIVGLGMDKTIAATLTTQAMSQAIVRRNPDKGLICHSDRGSQYAGNDFKAIFAKHKFVGSMSGKGDCWDNAVAESFFHTLKVELVHKHRFKTREEAKRRIFQYVERYYNRKRTHSTLNYLSPFEFEKRAALTKQTVH